MIRVRFHGRGGHGVKMASRILGSAAFAAGYEVQDSPIYGAERRGAAVSASTRINDEPILERGPIAEPDLIIVADETLLTDPAAFVLGGQAGAAAVFVNTQAPDRLTKKGRIGPKVESLDLSSMAIAAIGSASALSAGVGAAAARLTGCIELDDVVAAVEGELGASEAVAANVDLAREVYQKLSAVELPPRGAAKPQPVRTVGSESVMAGSPSILATGNADHRKTGSWRVMKPEIDYDMCTRCGLCLVQCPDGAIALDDEGFPVIDYEHCKGCMICQHLCPIRAIAEEREVRAW